MLCALQHLWYRARTKEQGASGAWATSQATFHSKAAHERHVGGEAGERCMEKKMSMEGLGENDGEQYEKDQSQVAYKKFSTRLQVDTMISDTTFHT